MDPCQHVAAPRRPLRAPARRRRAVVAPPRAPREHCLCHSLGTTCLACRQSLAQFLIKRIEPSVLLIWPEMVEHSVPAGEHSLKHSHNDESEGGEGLRRALASAIVVCFWLLRMGRSGFFIHHFHLFIYLHQSNINTLGDLIHYDVINADNNCRISGGRCCAQRPPCSAHDDSVQRGASSRR